jgi:hypothetical protein
MQSFVSLGLWKGVIDGVNIYGDSIVGMDPFVESLLRGTFYGLFSE